MFFFLSPFGFMSGGKALTVTRTHRFGGMDHTSAPVGGLSQSSLLEVSMGGGGGGDNTDGFA